ncbi:unnamed protein product, partial [Closterium sp. Yama58-4]
MRDCSTRRTAASAPVTTSSSDRRTIAAACVLLHHMAAAAVALSPLATAGDLALLRRLQRLAWWRCLDTTTSRTSAVADELACWTGDRCSAASSPPGGLQQHTSLSWRRAAAVAGDALEQLQQRMTCGSSTSSSWQAQHHRPAARLQLHAFSVVTSSITRQDQQHMTACSFTCHFAAAPDALPGGLQQQLAVCSNTCLAAPGWLRLVGCTCRAAPAPGGLQQQQLLSCTTSSSCPM